MNEKLGHTKKTKLAFVDDVESLNVLLQSCNVVPKEERGQKRIREEPQVQGDQLEERAKVLEVVGVCQRKKP